MELWKPNVLSKATPFKIEHQDEHAVEQVASRLSKLFLDKPHRERVVICIGTDRSTGDALGPLVGSKLKKLDPPLCHIYGTLDSPVHAINLADTIEEIKREHPHAYIVAVDACLGQLNSVGSIQLCEGPLKPGAGVNKDLPPVGDSHLTGIVNVGGFMEYFVLQNTRLSLVMNLAEKIASALYLAQCAQHPERVAYAPSSEMKM